MRNYEVDAICYMFFDKFIYLLVYELGNHQQWVPDKPHAIDSTALCQDICGKNKKPLLIGESEEVFHLRWKLNTIDRSGAQNDDSAQNTDIGTFLDSGLAQVSVFIAGECQVICRFRNGYTENL